MFLLAVFLATRLDYEGDVYSLDGADKANRG